MHDEVENAPPSPAPRRRRSARSPPPLRASMAAPSHRTRTRDAVSRFEYLLAFVSILVGLSVADLAASLHRLLRARHRVRWDWLPLLASLVVLMLVLQFWWGFFRMGQMEVWGRFGAFLTITVSLIVLYLLASAALPDEVPDAGLDLREYYAGNARYFWTLFALSALIPTAIATALRPDPVSVRSVLQALPNLVVASLVLSLGVVRRRAYHVVVVVVLFAFLAVTMSRMTLG